MNKYYFFLSIVVPIIVLDLEECKAQRTEIAALSTSLSSELSGEFTLPEISLTDQKSDSLSYRRSIFSGKFYQKDSVMSRKKMIKLFKDEPKLLKQYHFGKYLRPVGPLVSLGGIFLGYIAVKGKPASVEVEGKNYDYTIRSAPKLLAGIGALVAGLCLIEWSNELLSKSADRHNNNLGKSRKSGFIQHINLGITPSGNVGLCAKF